MKKERLYEIGEEICRAQIKPEEETLFGYVKEMMAQWVNEECDWENCSEDFIREGLRSQVRYYIQKYKEYKGEVKSTKEWEMLEEAYLIKNGKLDPKKSKHAKRWKGLGWDPESIMFDAMERFAQKRLGNIDVSGFGNDFLENVVAEAIAATGGYRKKDVQSSESIYEKCKNEKAFCAYFGKICMNKFTDALGKHIKESMRYESYDAFLEKGIEVGETENSEMGSSSLYTPKQSEWQKELQALVKLVLWQVAEAPLGDNGDVPGFYRNLGGAFAKYVPFIGEEFIKKNNRYVLFTRDDWEVPEEKINRPKARKGAKQAAAQMYPVLKDYTAKGGAVFFSQIINANLKMTGKWYDWTDAFYDEIKEYEKNHGKKRYGEVIDSIKTMENHANELHREAIKKSIEIVEKRLTEIGKSKDNVFLKMLKESIPNGEKGKPNEEVEPIKEPLLAILDEFI